MTDLGTATPPHLDLSFRHHPIRGTWLDRRLFRWPYTLSRTFRQPDSALMLILQTVSGAIQASDRLVQHIQVGPGAAVHIATQGAMPVHRARSEVTARDDITLDIADHSSLAYMPDLRILFPDSGLSQRVRIRIADTATAIIADGFVMHDPAGTARPFRDYHSELRLQRTDGTLLSLDRTALTAPPSGSGKRARYTAFGTLLIAVRQPEAWLEAFCAAADSGLAGLPEIYAAASALPNGAGATVRIAAKDGRHLRLGLQAAHTIARLHLQAASAHPHPRPSAPRLSAPRPSAPGLSAIHAR